MSEQILTQIPDLIETPSVFNKFELLTDEEDVEKYPSITESEHDSFDDEEEEMIVTNSLYSSFSTSPLIACPICLEASILQSAPCCTFRCCNSCWRAHIASVINDGRVKISCASHECNKYLTRETIVTFIRLDSTLHERYLKLYANVNQNPRAKTCPRCSHLYSLDTQVSSETKDSKKVNKKLPKQVQCSECALVWCFRCSAPWHENLTCKQFIKGDRLLLKWINQKNEDQWNARKCPKCSSVIQRNGGCPHMTCSSCSCEFCYLCGRRYIKIPVIGQHNNKFSVLGCPYNLHPEKPWLRRTIRGAIATGVVVAAPLIAVGAVTAAVTVLPTIGIYRLVRHVRNRRAARAAIPLHGLVEVQEDEPDFMMTRFDHDDIDIDTLRLLQLLNSVTNTIPNEDDFPLSIFADMDVENLFIEYKRATISEESNVREDSVITTTEERE